MGVVRGDRIAESQKLNRCSVDAQDFYGRFVDLVPDDFGRFRRTVAHVFVRMYPRREPTPAALRRVGHLMAELEREGLWAPWEVDGVTFAQLTNYTPTGNRWHRTPEPPGTFHVHQGACLPTAIHRAKEWGDLDGARALSIQLNEIRERRRTGARPKRQKDRERKGAPPSPPLPVNSTETELRPPAVRAASPPASLFPLQSVQSKQSVTAVTGVRTTAKAVPTGWVGQAGEDWRIQYDAAPNWGRLGRVLKPLVDEHGWPTVRLHYLAETEGKWATAERFAETYGHWAGTALPPARAAPATISERNAETLKNWLQPQQGERDGT
jgi:hypothetical protein